MAKVRSCSAPCQFRTYGKYRSTWKGKRVPNPDFKPKGRCSLENIELNEDGRCASFLHWDAGE